MDIIPAKGIRNVFSLKNLIYTKAITKAIKKLKSKNNMYTLYLKATAHDKKKRISPKPIYLSIILTNFLSFIEK